MQPITQADIQSMEQEILPVKVKPGGPIQNFDQKMNFWKDSNEIEIRLPLLNCLNILEYIWWLLSSDFKRWIIIILNNFKLKQTSPKKYSQKFSKLNLEKIARRHLMKSQKYWNCKVLLGIITSTIIQLNFLLHY